MKPFEELSDAEKAELTVNQIEAYVDFRCAYEGIPFLPPAPVTPKPENEPQPDLTLYQVGSLTEYLLVDIHVAQQIADMINAAKGYNTEYLSRKPGSYEKKVSPSRRVDVAPVKAWSQEAAQSQTEKVDTLAELKQRYEDESREYDAIRTKRQRVIDDIADDIRQARAIESRRRNLREEFKRYLELADNNRGMALRFLLNARSDAQDVCPELFENATLAPPTIPLDAKRAYTTDDEPVSL